MTEVYCEFTRSAAEPSATSSGAARAELVEAVEDIRRAIDRRLRGGVDVGAARAVPSLGAPKAIHVECYFEDSSIRNELSRTIEDEAESHGVTVHVDHNTLVLQKRLDAVAFAVDPRAAAAAVRGNLPDIPLSFRAFGTSFEGLPRYAVIAHNVRHVENFDARKAMDVVDAVLSQWLLGSGAYRRCSDA